MICTNFQKMSGRFSVFAFMFYRDVACLGQRNFRWHKDTYTLWLNKFTIFVNLSTIGRGYAL